ncbi:MAG: pseudouridine synthase [Bacteroidota bacterium]
MSESPYRYFTINKPYNMVSQFVSADKVNLLGDLDFDFPEGTHAIGRLDGNSEGLLILTTNKKVTRLLFQGEVPHTRKYLVLVNKQVSEESLNIIRTGVPIIVDKGATWVTSPCEAEIVPKPEGLFPCAYKFSERAEHTWLTITLTEGRFHQVRKMVAAVRHNCRRLIRLSIEDLTLGDLQPGGVKEWEEKEFFELLKITGY